MKIIDTNPDSPDAIQMMNELSDKLETITGNSGRHSFNADDVCVPRSLFVVAYDDDSKPIGCGAIRPVTQDIAELKRMYASTCGKGIGSKVLKHLEERAQELGYSIIWLETRIVNKTAVDFYEKKGYIRIPNYGKYVSKPEAVCFEKKLI